MLASQGTAIWDHYLGPLFGATIRGPLFRFRVGPLIGTIILGDQGFFLSAREWPKPVAKSAATKFVKSAQGGTTKWDHYFLGECIGGFRIFWWDH